MAQHKGDRLFQGVSTLGQREVEELQDIQEQLAMGAIVQQKGQVVPA